jgi:hypothetical protein
MNRKEMLFLPSERQGCSFGASAGMRKSPNRGPPSSYAETYTQPELLLPHATCTPWLVPLRTKLVDGTAAIEAIASAEAISFFVFDI